MASKVSITAGGGGGGGGSAAGNGDDDSVDSWSLPEPLDIATSVTSAATAKAAAAAAAATAPVVSPTAKEVVGGATDVGFGCPLVFESADDDGDGSSSNANDGVVSKEAFVDVLHKCTLLEGVFLNACGTADYAAYISGCLPDVRVVAWDGTPTDFEAVIFARLLYGSLGEQHGATPETTFDTALAEYEAYWESNPTGKRMLVEYSERNPALRPRPTFLRPIFARGGDVVAPKGSLIGGGGSGGGGGGAGGD